MPQHDALVVALHPTGEATLVVELLSRESGRLAAVARGGRRSGRRFAGALDPLVRLSAETTPPRRGELHDLVDAHVVHAFPRLRQDVMALGRAAYVAELARALSAREHATAGVFELVVNALTALEEHPAGPGFLRWAEAHLLGLVGVLPPTNRCADCGGVLSAADGVHLDPSLPGHFSCAACHAPGAEPLAEDAAALLVAAAGWDARAARDAPVPAAASTRVGRLLDQVARPLLPQPLRSRRFLVQLQRTGHGP